MQSVLSCWSARPFRIHDGFHPEARLVPYPSRRFQARHKTFSSHPAAFAHLLHISMLRDRRARLDATSACHCSIFPQQAFPYSKHTSYANAKAFHRLGRLVGCFVCRLLQHQCRYQQAISGTTLASSRPSSVASNASSASHVRVNSQRARFAQSWAGIGSRPPSSEC